MKLNKKLLISIPTVIAFLSLFIMVYINSTNLNMPFKNYSSFLKDVDNKIVHSVNLSPSSKIEIILNDGSKYLTDNPNSLNLKESLLKNNIEVNLNSSISKIQTVASLSFILSIIFIIAFFMSNRKTKGGISCIDTQDVSSSMANNFNFNSVAGNDEVKENVKDIVDYLRNPEKYKKYGARMPKGIILHGDPGTGKTLIAKAIAGEANVPFYAVSGSDFIQMYVGVGASRIRHLFKKAKSNKKAVIFIDEIDAIGKKRSNSTNGSSEEKDQTLNALLTEMSGFNESHNIVVIAATNRLDVLDSALLRPGRFDRHIEVALPDISAREKIISLHLKNKPYNNFNLKDLAIKTAYFSGAKIESLINEAAILACKENAPYITEHHLDKSFSNIIAGYEKIDKTSLTSKDKEITAYHEAGHALVSLLKLPNEKVSKISIIPTTKGAGGYTLSLPQDSNFQTIEYLTNKVMVFLGGRASEEIVFGKKNITTGAYNDLKQSTNIIYSMIAEYGMGESLGLIRVSGMPDEVKNASSKMIFDECKETIESLYLDTKNIILNNIDTLNVLAQNLIEKETLHHDEILNITKL